jgi:hypothetical protein
MKLDFESDLKKEEMNQCLVELTLFELYQYCGLVVSVHIHFDGTAKREEERKRREM